MRLVGKVVQCLHRGIVDEVRLFIKSKKSDPIVVFDGERQLSIFRTLTQVNLAVSSCYLPPATTFHLDRVLRRRSMRA